MTVKELKLRRSLNSRLRYRLFNIEDACRRIACQPDTDEYLKSLSPVLWDKLTELRAELPPIIRVLGVPIL